MVLSNNGKRSQMLYQHSHEILLEVAAIRDKTVIHPDTPPFSGQPAGIGQIRKMPGDCTHSSPVHSRPRIRNRTSSDSALKSLAMSLIMFLIYPYRRIYVK